MHPRKLFLSVFLVIVLTGCGHVAGNYPDSKVAPPSLPEKYKSPRGKDTVLVWNDPGRVHGFLAVWRDTAERAEAFRGLAAQSNLEVHREGARMFQKLSDGGIAEMVLFSFYAREVVLTCRTGDFEVTFTDGTVVRDLGVLRHEPRDMAKPYRISTEGPVKLSAEPVEKGEPLPMSIFVSKDHLGRIVESVRFVGKG